MPLRILHVLSALGQGGIEKWLVHLTAEWQRQHGMEIQVEFLTLLNTGGYYEDVLEEMGCRVQHCQLAWRNLPGFIRRLRAILREGRYDVVHCHADYLSGLVLPVARAAGVRIRIGHVHATRFAFQALRPAIRHLAGRLLRRLHVLDGGICVGASAAALDAYLGPLKHRPRHRVCTCGIPMANYRTAVRADRRAIRQSLNWPEGAKVILHVGRHTETKNLFFLLEVFAAIHWSGSSALCALAGSGPLTAGLEERAREFGLAKRVIFLGNRDDVPELMRGADLLVFPSLFEGLGLAVVEAQAVGLRSLISDVIPPEVEVAKGCVDRLPLSVPTDAWAGRAVEIMGQPPPDPETCLSAVGESPYNIENSAEALMAVYEQAGT